MITLPNTLLNNTIADADAVMANFNILALLAGAPQGTMFNGKISVTDAAGITVAIKTLAGTDPSATDPVYVRIGDTVRTISTALSFALADGTNWMNAGSAELATNEIDYFNISNAALAGVCLGVTINSAILGADSHVITGGAIAPGIGGLTPGAKYYVLNSSGDITTALPTNPGEILQCVGYAIDATTFFVEIHESTIIA